MQCVVCRQGGIRHTELQQPTHLLAAAAQHNGGGTGLWAVCEQVEPVTTNLIGSNSNSMAAAAAAP